MHEVEISWTEMEINLVVVLYAVALFIGIIESVSFSEGFQVVEEEKEEEEEENIADAARLLI